MSKYYAYVKKGTKKYYFNGDGFETLPFRMKKYPSLSALKTAVKPYAQLLPVGAKLYSEIVGKAKPIKKGAKKKKRTKKKKR